MYSIGLKNDTETLLFGGSASYRVSDLLALGIGLRVWWAAAGRGCSSEDDSCLLTEELDAIAGFGLARLTPFSTRLLHFRVGAGLTHLREQSVPGFVMRQTIDWPFTLLGGVASDVRVLEAFYLSPSVELIRSFIGEDALSVSPEWIVQFGLGLTVG